MMIEAVEARFGSTDERAITVEFLSDNGGAFRAIETHELVHELGVMQVHTPVNSPQSNGMAESFVNTFKRDYVGCMTSAAALPCWRNCPTHSGTSTRCIRIRRWGTNRRA